MWVVQRLVQDHLDIDAIEKQNIQWANAAGCNAQAVADM